MSFSCQRCRQPLQMDDSIADLSPSAYDMVSSSLSDRSTAFSSNANTGTAQNVKPLPTLDSNRLAKLSPLSRQVYAQSSRTSRPLLVGGRMTTPGPINHTYLNSNPNSATISMSPERLGMPSPKSPISMPSSPAAMATKGMAPTESFVVLTESTMGPPTAPSSPSSAHAVPPSKPTSTPPLSKHSKPIPTASSSTTSTPSHPTPPSTLTRTPALTNNAPQFRQQLDHLSRLFDLLSGQYDIDHPLCNDCTNHVLELMEVQLREAKIDRDRYVGFERDVVSMTSGTASTSKSKKSEMEEFNQLQTKQNHVMEQLKECERQRNELESEMNQLDLEEQALTEQEEEFWKEYNTHSLELDQLVRSARCSQTGYAHDMKELERLQKTNVYNDAFCIGHEGGVATINGLRLGRLPDVPVEWTEINAAWGHMALLLQTLAERLGMEFEGRRIVPMGSSSRIERIKEGDKGKLELYGSEENALTRVFHNRRFDSGMVEYLECVRQVCERAVERNARIRLPHKIHKDKIGDVSIKLSFSSEEAWTRALKHVLLTLKILNAHVDA